MAKDKYANFAQLKASEAQGSWRTEVATRGSSLAVIAPHGGGIEQGTSEIARAIAGNEFSLYLFEGLKVAGNRDLHITSTNFDEPVGVKLVSESESVLAIHGEANERAAVAYLGGLHAELAAAISKQLTAAGFAVGKHDKAHLQGTHLGNICNRGQSWRGVQLELSKGLRKQLFASLDTVGRQKTTKPFAGFVSAIRRALGA
jgi:phage replication-related protein YjqB (UPF0714/DUF867 family)